MLKKAKIYKGQNWAYILCGEVKRSLHHIQTKSILSSYFSINNTLEHFIWVAVIYFATFKIIFSFLLRFQEKQRVSCGGPAWPSRPGPGPGCPDSSPTGEAGEAIGSRIASSSQRSKDS